MNEPCLPGRFIVQGEVFDLEGLRARCGRELAKTALPEWARGVYRFILDFLDPGETEMQQYTSGTTGEPRRSILSRPAMLNSAARTLDYFGLAPGASVLLCLPIRYIAGKMMVVRALLGELNLWMVEPSGRPLCGLPPAAGRIAFAAMVPLQLHNCLGDVGERAESPARPSSEMSSLSPSDNSGWPESESPSLFASESFVRPVSADGAGELEMIDCLLIGGGEIHPDLRKQASGLESPRVYESFAMTETYSHFALRRINGADSGEAFRAMDGVKLSLDNRGCLVVDVPGVTRAPVVTNDLVELASEAGTFHWLGRIDHVINSGGIKLIPEPLEARIRALLGADCLLLPEKDKRLGQRMVLLLERDSAPGEAGVPALKQSWMAKLKQALQPHECPSRIEVIDRLPRNASMKPDRMRALQFINPVSPC